MAIFPVDIVFHHTGYNSWLDDYWMMYNSPNEYQKAEGILLCALARLTLRDRTVVLDCLQGLYFQWDRPE